MRPFHPLMRRAFLWTIVMQMLALLEPAIITTVVDDMSKHGKAAQARLLLFALAGFLGLIVIGLVKVAKDRAVHVANTVIYRDIQLWCAEKLYRLPLAFHQRVNSGELIGKVTRGTGKILEVECVLMFEIIPLVTQMVLSTALLLYLHWKTTLVLLPGVAIFIYLTEESIVTELIIEPTPCLGKP
jgi:ABC-type multidrug transport system fused ATPase/permease subunit